MQTEGKLVTMAKGVTARTPSGKFVSHVNDLAVYHVRPRHTGPSGKLLRVSKNHDWIGRENDGVKLMDPRVEIPTANRVGRKLPASLETVEKSAPKSPRGTGRKAAR